MKLWKWFFRRFRHQDRPAEEKSLPEEKPAVHRERILVLDTNILLDEIEEIQKLPDASVHIPWAVVQELQSLYWKALGRRISGDLDGDLLEDIEDEDIRWNIQARDEKSLKVWPIVYKELKKENSGRGKWQFIGSRGEGRVDELFEELCILSKKELSIWLDVIESCRDGHGKIDLWSAFEKCQDIHWRALWKKIQNRELAEVERAIEQGWDIISVKARKDPGKGRKGRKDQGKWWLDQDNYARGITGWDKNDYTRSSSRVLRRRLVQIFNWYGHVDVRILASILVLEGYDHHKVYLVTKDRRLTEAAYNRYWINVLSTLKATRTAR